MNNRTYPKINVELNNQKQKDKIVERAKSLGLTTSRYIKKLVFLDLEVKVISDES